MLKPRRANRPAIRVSTPGLVLDQDREHVLAAGAQADRGVELLEAQRLPWFQARPSRSPHHVARGGAGRRSSGRCSPRASRARRRRRALGVAIAARMSSTSERLVREAQAGRAVGLGELDEVRDTRPCRPGCSAGPRTAPATGAPSEIAVVHDEHLDRDPLLQRRSRAPGCSSGSSRRRRSRRPTSSGSRPSAPIAAGRPKPIVPRPPELIHWRGRVKWKYCAAHIWCWPTSETTIASPPVASYSAWTMYCGLISVSALSS